MSHKGKNIIYACSEVNPPKGDHSQVNEYRTVFSQYPEKKGAEIGENLPQNITWLRAHWLYELCTIN